MSRILLSLSLLLTACGGGSWSNRDLEFANALPDKEELRSSLPTDTTRAPLEGTAQRQDELVGDRSATYEKTRKAAQEFNGGLDRLLSIIEAVRVQPPTHREGDRRSWGPFPVGERSGFEGRVVMDKLQEGEFAYRLELRKKDSGTWFALLTGQFQASAGIREGSGGLTLWAKVARDNGVPTPDLVDLDYLDITYATDSDPVHVSMVFKLVPRLPGAPSDLRYESRQFEDGRGWIRFAQENALFPPLVGLQSATYTSAWLASGEGRAEARIVAGSGAGLQEAECWDQAFSTTWFQPWGGAATGSASPGCTGLAQLMR